MKNKGTLPELDTFTLLNPDFDIPREEYDKVIKQEKEFSGVEDSEILGNGE